MASENSDSIIIEKVLNAVVPGADDAAKLRRQRLANSVKGEGLLVVSNLSREFWENKAASIIGDAEDKALDRQLLTASGLALTTELGHYAVLAASGNSRSSLKQQAEDFKELLDKLKTKLGCTVPANLIPSLKVLNKMRNGDYLELQEFKLSDSQSRATTRTTATTVSGDTVEILVDAATSASKQKTKYGLPFIPAGEAALCLMRWMVGCWICDCSGEFLRLTGYVAEVFSLAMVSNWGIALRADATHRRAIPARVMAGEGSFYDFFKEDYIARSFSLAALGTPSHDDFEDSRKRSLPSSRRSPNNGSSSTKLLKKTGEHNGKFGPSTSSQKINDPSSGDKRSQSP